MILKFKKKITQNGNILKMVIDTEKKTVERGYNVCMYADYELKAKDFDALVKELTYNGYTIKRD